MATYKEAVKKYFTKLKIFTLAITKRHGKNHPEVFEVRDLFKTINKKSKFAKVKKPDLDTEFAQLRKVTNNYTIPADACEAYTSVYTMLSEVDKAYQS